MYKALKIEETITVITKVRLQIRLLFNSYLMEFLNFNNKLISIYVHAIMQTL